jgi:Mn2+/Fe2+ NRAMP family transporter
VKKLFAVALGILTAIGGFVDIGDLVTNGHVGSRFGMSLGWVVIVGIVGICVFAEMSGRVAAVSGRATFDLVRERLGARMGLANLVASMAVTLLTFIAEIGGVALALQLATSVNEYLWVPVVGAAVWLVLWRVKFSVLENAFGLAGLALIVFAVALWKLGPDWDALWRQASQPLVPHDESHWTYAYYAIALFGAAMTPYEVFFFSSGGVEENWTAKDLGTMRANVFIGFPLGGLLSLAIAATATVVFQPAAIQVDTLGQIALPVTLALGKVGLALVLGKFVEPLRAARFHTVVLVSSITAIGVLLTTVDPIMLTEYSVVFSAIALPLTYFPILVVANDRTYMGEHVNGKLANGLGSLYLCVVVVAAVAAIPLMVVTKAGQ